MREFCYSYVTKFVVVNYEKIKLKKQNQWGRYSFIVFHLFLNSIYFLKDIALITLDLNVGRKWLNFGQEV